jgi:hypothetical protein
MSSRLFTLITRARRDLQEAAEELEREAAQGMPTDEIDSSLLEVRARVLALEARVGAIEERSKE